MGWHLRRGRLVERTCLDCGETWTLKPNQARGKRSGIGRRGFSSGTVMMSHGNPIAMGRSGMDQQMAELHRRDADADHDLDVDRQLLSCPKCGSDRHTDRLA
jgi:hypothetical protein